MLENQPNDALGTLVKLFICCKIELCKLYKISHTEQTEQTEQIEQTEQTEQTD